MNRGLGAGSFLDMSQDPSLNCGLFQFGVFRPECWAQLYEQEQYGRITRPGDSGLPTPAAPSTQAQMTQPGSWTQGQATREGYADYIARLRGRIQADEEAGNYSPAGRLPFSAEQWLEWAPWILGGAAVVVLIARTNE